MPHPAQLYTTEAPSRDAAFHLEQVVAKQRRADTIQSFIAAFIVVGLIAGVLWLIAIMPRFVENEVIVTYAAPVVPEENPVDRPELSSGLRPKPASSSSAMARVIAASVEAPVAVPVPEIATPTTPFGMDDDFMAGFGAGDGDGDGGGGSSFFGSPRKGRRVVYVVDYSESMLSETSKGGTRMAALKKELTRSISALKPSMNFNVIFFAQTAWTVSTDGPDYANNGWNGLNEVPSANWYQATDHLKGVFKKQIADMPTGLGTVWYSPLKMAFSMSPPPDIVYLLSDGEPSDLNEVLVGVSDMNPTGVPIDTFAMEEPGEEAAAMMEMAKETGGRFTMIYEGRAIGGRSAEKYTSDEWED
ncbi:MAG: hypothetical protein ACPG4K_08275 [Haloferula sp.]